MKNDNILSFFSLFWLQILNLPASLQNKNTRVGPFPWKRSVLQNPDRERTNQSSGICLRLGLPYNKMPYYPSDFGSLILIQIIPKEHTKYQTFIFVYVQKLAIILHSEHVEMKEISAKLLKIIITLSGAQLMLKQ